MPNKVTDYIAKITAEHADKPSFVAFVTALVQPLVDAQDFFGTLLTTFDLDTAVGAQLDAVGKWVGRSRQVTTPLAGIYFSLDTTGLGFNQGSWKGQFDPNTGLTNLDDDTYRLLLKAKVIMNSWDGTIAVAASALTELFGKNPNTIISIQDNQDMTMTVSISGQIPGSIIIALLQGGYVPISPEGVGVNYVITSVNTAALFGFDTENQTISGMDVGAWSGTPGIGPGPPVSFSLVSVTSTGATFSWLPPVVGTGPYTYQLQYQIGTGNGVWVLEASPVSTTTITVNNLSPSTTYTFEVFAINSAGSGTPSIPVTVTTSGGLPGQVVGLHSTASTTSTVSLTWTTVVGNSISYQVQYRPSGTGPFVSFGFPISAATITVTGLTQGQSYDFQVIAINAAGQGTPSTTVTAGTSGSSPGAIQGLTSPSNGTNDVVLTWNQPNTNNGPYTYKVVFAQNVNPLSFQTFAGNITVTALGGTCDVTGLTAGQSYVFEVSATNILGTGPLSAPLTVNLGIAIPSAPTSLTTQNVTTTSIDVTWPVVSGATTYQPQIAFLATPTQWANVGSPTSATTATASSLTVGTAYVFRVNAINSAGVSGPPSPVATAVTIGTVPAQVTGLVPSNLTNTTVTLTWTADTGTPIIVYLIEYKLHAATAWTTFHTGPVTIFTIVVTALQSGQLYDFRVTASNDFGTALPSAVVSAATINAFTPVSWNPSDHSPAVELTNGNNTVTIDTPPVSNIVLSQAANNALAVSWTPPNPVGLFAVRGTTSIGTGKVFIEFKMDVVSTDIAVGIANSAWNFTSAGGSGLGKNANSLGIYPNVVP